MGIDVQQVVMIELGEFPFARLEAWAGPDRAAGTVLSQAVYYYLADEHSGRSAWPYPRFRRDRERGEASADVSLRIEGRVWDAFQAEAAKQGVPVPLLLEHAVFYFLADLDSGRVTERIVKNWS